MRIVPRNRASVIPGERIDGTKLTVIGEPFYLPHAQQWAVCQCDCGTLKAVRIVDARAGKSSSCGCLQWPPAHGWVGTRLHRIWTGMLTRCRNPNDHAYPKYGGSGISVCEEWETFVLFRDWAMENGYADNLTIDRRDNGLGYFPDNCRWATYSEQNQNKRSHSGAASNFKGVARGRRAWTAQITARGVQHYLGTFPDQESAGRAYDEAAKRLHGEFACLNFPETFSDSAPRIAPS